LADDDVAVLRSARHCANAALQPGSEPQGFPAGADEAAGPVTVMVEPPSGWGCACAALVKQETMHAARTKTIFFMMGSSAASGRTLEKRAPRGALSL